MLNTLPEIAWAAWLLGGCAVACWKGGRDERLTAGLLALAWITSQFVLHRRWTEVQWGVAAVDVLLLVALGGIALRGDRFWPLFATAFQLLVFAGHAAQALDRTLGGWAYLSAGVFWSYLVVAALAAGAWLESGRPRV